MFLSRFLGADGLLIATTFDEVGTFLIFRLNDDFCSDQLVLPRMARWYSPVRPP